MAKIYQLSGERFGMILVIGPDAGGMSISGRAFRRWKCLCDCGREFSIRTTSLTAKRKSNSCGCQVMVAARKAVTTHGHGKAGGKASPTYQVWISMRSRCKDLSNIDYGGRGIRVCKRWERFENFLQDMGLRPSGMTIDRIDMNGNYEKANCRWATTKQQNRNKSNNVVIEVDGERHCISEWAEKSGLPFSTVYSRIRKGWTAERALKTPMTNRGELHFSKRHPEMIPRGEACKAAKLTENEVRQIWKLNKYEGVTQRELSEKFHVSGFTISQICRRVTWCHVTKGFE